MKLLSAWANFGMLQNAQLELKDGLNVFSLENEGGKTTWCAFFVNMLYGLPTGGRNRKDALADKNKYLPWNGGAMGGRLVVEHFGRRIVIERTTSRLGPMQAFSARYEDSGEEVAYLSADNCGETLCGIGRAAFEKSAFIRNGEVSPAGGADELERRIQTLASTGDDGVSYAAAKEKLKRQQLDIRQNRSRGLLPQALAALEETEEQIANVRALAERETALRINEENCRARRAAYEAELETAQTFERYDHYMRLSQAKEALRARERARDECGAALETPSGRLKRADHARLADMCAKLSALYVEKAEADAHLAALAARQTETAPEPEPRSARPCAAVLILLCTGLAALVLGFFFLPYGAVISAVGAGLIAYGLYLNRAITRAAREAAQKRAQRSSAAAAAGGAVSEAKARAAAAAERTAEAEAALGEAIGSTLAGPALLDEARKAAAVLDERLTAFEKASAAYDEAAARFDALCPAGEIEPCAPPQGAPPAHDAAFLRGAIARESAAIEQAAAAAAHAAGRRAAAGDLAALTARREELDASIASLEARQAVLDEACALLDGANEEILSRVSPILSRRAGEFMSVLTNGRYEKLQVRRELDALVSDGGVSRTTLSLSAGTADCLYLALRLAICTLALPERENAPLIFDDALLTLDDRRAEAALRLLAELAKTRQILLFSCHGREKELYDRLFASKNSCFA